MGVPERSNRVHEASKTTLQILREKNKQSEGQLEFKRSESQRE